MAAPLIVALAALAVACGSHGSGGPDAPPAGDAATADAPPFTGTCDPTSGPQCSNCRDDDDDGKIDGFDLQCTGPRDNDESSFATGIPGDNIDAINQDCFFDGNSGGGNDGCNQHVCCLLGAMTKDECATKLTGIVNNPRQEGNKYNVAECFAPLGAATVPPQCMQVCGPLTPPGCDCFGCCTVCDPASPGTCYDIALNPTTSPGCSTETLGDPAICKRCTKVPSCGNTQCGGDSCVLCPGQDPSTLPASCSGAMCPTGVPACDAGGQCPEGTYCSTGCCIEAAG
ncbi:MAG: hypothetical protein R3B48_11785 [Kofleriaceae bacterium]